MQLSGLSPLRFDGGLSTDAGSQLPGTLASPWRLPGRDSHPQADLSLSPVMSPHGIPPYRCIPGCWMHTPLMLRPPSWDVCF